MKQYLLAGLLIFGASPFQSLHADDQSDGVYHFREHGRDKVYEVDRSVVSGLGNRAGVTALASAPKDAASFRKAFQSKQQQTGKRLGMVFYPVGKEKKQSLRRVLYDQVVLSIGPQSNPEAISQRLGAKKFKVVKGVGKTLLILTYKDANEVLDKLADCKADAQVKYARPLLSERLRKMAEPNDPLFRYANPAVGYQWHLWNTGDSTGTAGVDVNIRDAWDSYTGAGVTIAIADDGLEIAHPDLQPNTGLFPHYSWAEQTGDPTPPANTDNSHGTSVGGVSAARWNNHIGGSGSAPEASLVGLRWLDYGVPGYEPSNVTIGEFLGWGAGFTDHGATNIDVHNNSWGPGHPTFFRPWADEELAGLMSGINLGRGGLGTIYMFAAGNDGHVNGNVNHSDTTSSIYTIAIGAINDVGVNSAYSTPGCALVVSAPSSDPEFISGEDHQGITTTEFRGLPGGSDGYTYEFGGTSSATPLTSGIVALMLEANPNLGWRDVQEILIATARKIDAFDADWQENAAGFYFNHKYGAGMVDATAAVEMAVGWENLLPQTQVSVDKPDINQPIPEQGGSLDVDFDFFRVDPKRIEHIEVALDINHGRRADIQCVLVSPSGVESRLLESFRDADNESNVNFTLMSTFLWGENSAGIWTVKFTDTRRGVEGTLTNIKMTVYGVDEIPEIPPFVTGSDRVGVVVDTPLDYTLEARFADTVVLDSPLPPGLSFDPGTMKITGTPTVIDVTQVLFVLTNQYGVTEFVLTIYVGGPPSDNIAGAIEQEGESVTTNGDEGIWNLELVDTSDGSDAIASSLPLPDYGEAHVSLPHTGGGVVMFNWKVSSQAGADRLWFYPSGSGLQSWSGFLSGEAKWGAFATKLPDNNTTLKWSYIKDKTISSGEDRGFLDQVKFFSNEDFSAMLTSHSGSDLTFDLDGKALWIPVDMINSPDGKALRASAIGHGQFTDLSTVLEGPGILKFDWMVSSEPNDKFQFYMGGAPRATIRGLVGWSEKAMIIPSGSVRVSWRYVKNISRSGGSLDSAMLDSIHYIRTYTYETWADGQFSDSQIADPTISGVDADPNSNGINNLLEYAFGGNPLVIDGSLVLPTMVFDEDGYGFTYRKDIAYSDIEYIMEESTNLVDWTTVDGTLISSEGTYETYRYELTPSDTDTERFLRVRVVK